MRKMKISKAAYSVKIMKALANQNRLQICNLIYQQEFKVTAIAEILGLDFRLVSNYLVRMWRDGFLGVEQRDSEMYYHIKEGQFKIVLERLININ